MENFGQVNKRVDYKDIAIGTRKFRLYKFDALTGSYMLFKLVGILSPIFKNMNVEDVKEAKDKLSNVKDGSDLSGTDIASILTEITKIPKEDFEYIQKNCLMVVREIYPENPQPSPPVLNEYGTWGIIDVGMPLVLNLTVQSLVFNISGFFDGNPLGLNLEGLNIFQ